MLERLDEEDEDEGEKKKRHGLQAKTRRRRKRASITRRERPTILSTIAIELALFLEFWEGKRERARTRGPLKWSLLYPIGEREARKRERERLREYMLHDTSHTHGVVGVVFMHMNLSRPYVGPT